MPFWIALGATWSRRKTTATAAFLLSALGIHLMSAEVAVGTNADIVIVLCDDFNPCYTGLAGDPDSHTPSLDALARESAVFSNCYATSTVCMPSRTSLITGLYPHSTGCWGNAQQLFVSPELTSMFRDLRSAGYSTSMIGKTHWYAGSKFKDQFASKKDYFNRIGIDHFVEVATTFGSRGGSGVYQDFLREIGLFDSQSRDLTDRLRNNQYVPRPSVLSPEQTADWMMTDFAIEHLNETPTTQPLAMMIGFSNPHSPFDPSGQYAALYDPDHITLRPNVEPFVKYKTDYSLAEIRRARAAYLGKIRFLDDLLGRIIGALKQRQTWDKTILVFTADHGLAVGEHRNIAKGQFWEEVARVPMIIRIPGLTDDGVAVNALAQLMDLYPTLLDAVGGQPAPHVQAISLLPAIRQPDTPLRDAVLTEIHHGGSLDYMVRDQRFKWFVENGIESLYDLHVDPYEQTNLIESSTHSPTAIRLRDRLRTFLMTQQVNHSLGYQPLAERVKQLEPDD